MDIQIDDKKMWESLMKDKCGLDSITVNDILNALIEQGYTTNDNDEIVGIEPEPFKIETGKYYMCIHDIKGYDSFTSGKVYYSMYDNALINDNNIEVKIDKFTCKFFRPATPEEIPQKSDKDYQWSGKIDKKEPTGVLKEMLENLDEKEISKTREEMMKESPDGELSEFEKVYLQEYHHCKASELEEWKLAEIRTQAQKLLSVARKQFLSEYYHNSEHYELASTLESRYKARFEGYEDADYKVWAAQDAEVALVLAHNQIVSESRLGITKEEFEEELEHLYTYADEVVYNRGYDKGLVDARDKIAENIDADEMVKKLVFNTGVFSKDEMRESYRHGIEDTIKKIKEG